MSVNKEKQDRLSIGLLKELLNYNPDTGNFNWLCSRSGVHASKSFAGGKTAGGYLKICINGDSFCIHRLAWFYVYGYWPDQIDHINGIRDDNRIVNLRDVSSGDNGKNSSIPSHNTSGVLGVCWHKHTGRWRAQIQVEGKVIHLGCFDYFNDAVISRQEANIKYGFHKNHGKRIDLNPSL